jgi:hypothetical protein
MFHKDGAELRSEPAAVSGIDSATASRTASLFPILLLKLFSDISGSAGSPLTTSSRRNRGKCVQNRQELRSSDGFFHSHHLGLPATHRAP